MGEGHFKSKRQSYFPEELQWLWDTRYSSWWISDDEVFEFSERDYENKAKLLKDAGINTVITFGGFHDRWNWHHLWPRLLEVLSSIVKACHKFNIRVVEHHSAVLVGRLSDPQKIREYLRKYNINLARHPQYLKNFLTDPIIEGVKFSSMHQIDIRTGKSSQTQYQTYAFCPNNPDYQRLYLKHLEDIYRCGVDGIMTDDIQFLPGMYSCGCVWCRKLFTKETGYFIPENGFADERFFNNFDNPAFRAFINFRIKTCSSDFPRRVNEHFQRLGYILARPNYSSGDTTIFGPVGTGFNLEEGMPYFNTAFTEVCSVENPLACWSWLIMEFKHRSALSRLYGVPAMVLFYPLNPSQGYFCWAFSKLLGQNLWNTRWGATTKEESLLSAKGNNFQEKYPELFERPKNCGNIALFFSRRTRTNYQATREDFYVYEYAGWCQQLFLHNLLFDVVLEEDLEDGLDNKEYDLLILPNTACLSDKQVTNIKKFVKNGGKLIAVFETGHFDQNGNRRKRPALEDLFGVEDRGVINSHDWWRQSNTSRFFENLEPYIANCRPYRRIKASPSSEILLRSIWDPVCVRNHYGAGEVIYFAGYLGNQANTTHPIWPPEGDLYGPEGKNFFYGFNKSEPEIIKLLLQSVKKLLANRLTLETSPIPAGTLVGLFKHQRFHTLHILNATKTLRKHGEVFYQKGTWRISPLGEIEVRVRGLSLQKATIFSPDYSQPVSIPIKFQNKISILKIPEDTVRYYSVVKLE